MFRNQSLSVAKWSFTSGEERELVCVVEILTGDEKLNRVQEVDEMASWVPQAAILPATYDH